MNMKNKLIGLPSIILLLILCSSMAVSIGGCQKKEKEVAKHKEQITSVDESAKQEAEKNNAKLQKVTKPEFAAKQIRMFQVENNGAIKFQLDYLPRSDRQSFLYWDMTVPYESIAIIDSEAMYQLYETIASIQWAKLETVKASADNGIEASNNKITVAYVSKEQDPAEDTCADSIATIIVGKDNGKGQYFCAMEGAEDTVFLVNTYLLDAAFNQEPYDMILKIPYLLDIKTVQEVNITTEDKKVHMTQEKGTCKIDGKEIKEKDYQSLYSSLLQLGITGEYKSDSGPGEKIMTIAYKRTSQEYEDYIVNIYRVDDKNDAIEVNGKTFFMVSKEEVNNLVGLVDTQAK